MFRAPVQSNSCFMKTFRSRPFCSFENINNGLFVVSYDVNFYLDT